MIRGITTLLVLLTIAVWAQGSDLGENEMIVGGGRCLANGLWISGPSIYLRQNHPGVVVGMVQAPGQESRFTYVLVIKGDEQRKTQAGYDTRCEVSGTAALSQGYVQLGKRKVEIKYQLDLQKKETALPQEECLINGAPVDLKKGRFIEVDLAGGEVTWKQLSVEVPKVSTRPTQTAEVETQAKLLLAAVRQSRR